MEVIVLVDLVLLNLHIRFHVKYESVLFLNVWLGYVVVCFFLVPIQM